MSSSDGHRGHGAADAEKNGGERSPAKEKNNISESAGGVGANRTSLSVIENGKKKT